MSQLTNDLRFPSFASGGRGIPDERQSWAEPVEELRKGRLYLVSSPEAGSDLLWRFARRYYDAPSYDIIPSLQQALVWAYEEGTIGSLLAAVVCDLSLYVVAPEGSEAYLWRWGEVTSLLAEHSFRTEHPLGETSQSDEETAAPATGGVLILRHTVSRLCLGDWVMLAPALDAQIARQALAQAVRQSSAEQAARKATAFLQRKGYANVSLGFLAMPGLLPVSGAALEPAPKQPTGQSPKPLAMPPPREQPSPIRVALIIAIVAIIFALLVGEPSLSTEYLSEAIKRMLTPRPTLTMESPQTAEPITPD